MTTKEQLIELLKNNKKDVDYFDNNGNYDPNPYWLADEIVKLFTIPIVTNSTLEECNWCYKEFDTDSMLAVHSAELGGGSMQICRCCNDDLKLV